MYTKCNSFISMQSIKLHQVFLVANMNYYGVGTEAYNIKQEM